MGGTVNNVPMPIPAMIWKLVDHSRVSRCMDYTTDTSTEQSVQCETVTEASNKCRLCCTRAEDTAWKHRRLWPGLKDSEGNEDQEPEHQGYYGWPRGPRVHIPGPAQGQSENSAANRKNDDPYPIK